MNKPKHLSFLFLIRLAVKISLSLLLFLFVSSPVYAQSTVTIVPTFQSLGIYWQHSQGSSTAQVQYRPSGTTTWHTAHPMWYAGNSEYRSSIVLLNPGTTYEVRLTLGTSSVTTTATTWSENFPIGQTVTLPENTSQTVTINNSGTANGYLLYTHQSGKTATINTTATNNIRINGSYVIIRGLTLKNAGTDAIKISRESHDIIVENNTVTNWGGSGNSNNMAAAVSTDQPGNGYNAGPRIIIQNNLFTTPRGNSNTWDTAHPHGPQGVTLWETDGQNVIRSNTVTSNNSHYYNDGIGGGKNSSTRGNVYRDSDIYNNTVKYCRDDGLEIEGGNMNVRIWNNHIDNCFVGIATAANLTGPNYIFRNLITNGRQSDGNIKSAAFKLGSGSTFGAIYIYHTTVNNVRNGLTNWGGAVYNLTARNNILNTIQDSIGSTIASSNIYDHNTCANPETGCTTGTVAFESGSYIPTSSIAVDKGLPIPNFNDGYLGSAPDIGAFERGGTVPNPTATPTSGPTPTTGPSPTPPLIQTAYELEAESLQLSSPMTINSDSSASNGQYISSPIAEQGIAAFQFKVAQDGDYLISGKVFPTAGNDNSLYITIDQSSPTAADTWDILYQTIDTQPPTSWVWDQVSYRGTGTFDSPQTDPRIFTLSANHTYALYIQSREINTKLDKLRIEKTTTTPPTLQQFLTHWLTSTFDQILDGQVNSLDFSQIITNL